MAGLLFGTGGVPLTSRAPSTISGIDRIRELGLGAMELEFVHGVQMSEFSAQEVGRTGSRLGIALSAHAPYFINLHAREPEKVAASKERLLKTARIAHLCGARTVVFHAAFYLGRPPEETYDAVKKQLAEVLAQLKKERNDIRLRPEATGKPGQFGTMDEILRLCAELEGLSPCIDFAHLHARAGKVNYYAEFASVLEQLKRQLGAAALKDMHMHISGIRYSNKGELSHLNLKESDLNYTELMKALKDYGAGGLVICESPNLEEDAALLKITYDNLD